VLSIAQVFPGPIAVNLAVASGYQLAGLAGSVVAALGATLPSLVIILIIAIFFKQAYTLWWVQGLFFRTSTCRGSTHGSRCMAAVYQKALESPFTHIGAGNNTDHIRLGN